MIENMEFNEFPKIPRLRRGMVVTEKVDGSNAQIYIVEVPDGEPLGIPDSVVPVAQVGNRYLFAGSRTRWISPGKGKDNFGFAEWVKNNAEELTHLGPGKHFGEWFGSGIQRNYGLADKRLALFNVNRWFDPQRPDLLLNSPEKFQKALPCPSCCTVVPVLAIGDFNITNVDTCIKFLKFSGSQMVQNFMQPEGVVVFHSASRQLYKQTIENDETPKGQVREAV